jgi:hypothetical protein
MAKRKAKRARFVRWELYERCDCDRVLALYSDGTYRCKGCGAKYAPKETVPTLVTWMPNVKCECGSCVAEYSDNSVRCVSKTCGRVFRGTDVKVVHASRCKAVSIMQVRPETGTLTYTIVRQGRFDQRKYQRQLNRYDETLSVETGTCAF